MLVSLTNIIPMLWFVVLNLNSYSRWRLMLNQARWHTFRLAQSWLMLFQHRQWHREWFFINWQGSVLLLLNQMCWLFEPLADFPWLQFFDHISGWLRRLLFFILQGSCYDGLSRFGRQFRFMAFLHHLIVEIFWLYAFLVIIWGDRCYKQLFLAEILSFQTLRF